MDALFQDWPVMLFGLIAGYLSGSIPFGLLLTRLTGAGDLRAIGSGKVFAVSEPVHRGRRQQLWLVTIRDEQDRVVARGQVRLQNLEADPPQ